MLSIFKAEPFGLASKNAAGVVNRFQKLQSAIGSEVAGPLSEAVAELQAADASVSAAEIAAATGATNETASVENAKARRAEAREAVDEIATRLRGLRGGLMKMIGDVVAAHDGIKSAMPEYLAALKTSFEAEWAAGVRAFSELLGRRAAIEAALGEKLTLPSPAPTSVPENDTLATAQTEARSLRNCLDTIKGWGADASAQTGWDGHRLPDIQPHDVYVLRKDSCGLPAGTAVVEASLNPGRLRRLAALGEATPVTNTAIENAGWDARRAVDRINKQEQHDAEDRRHQRRIEKAKTATGETIHAQMYPSLSEEERARMLQPVREPDGEPDPFGEEKARANQKPWVSGQHPKVLPLGTLVPSKSPKDE